MDCEEWAGCYDSGWRDLITPESFAHPAKAARGLLVRIFDELFAMGALQRGGLVADPFGGIGSTAIEAASRGCRCICVELEEKFVALARENFALHAASWAAMGYPQPVMVQGDSRRLRACIGPALAACVVSSPPYAETVNASGHGIDWTKAGPATGNRKRGEGCKHEQTLRDQLAYGTTPGQLGAMKAGDVAAVVSSPPYARSLTQGNHPKDYDYTKYGGRGQLAHAQRYGKAEGQLGNMDEGSVAAVVSSPPYAAQDTGATRRELNKYDTGQERDQRQYGASAGQLARLPEGAVSAVVSSPPFEDSDQRGADRSSRGDYFQRASGKPFGQGASMTGYPDSPGQLGQERGDTFWTAARDIVAETHAILKPGGYAVWIVKSFVRNKRIVDFPGDWQRLCEACGFETVKEVHAMLVQEHRCIDLFGEERVTRKERKSFFRRLAESKGSPRIDYETVLFMVRR